MSNWLNADTLQAAILSPINGLLMDVNQLTGTKIPKIGTFKENNYSKTVENVVQGVIMVVLANILAPGMIGLVISLAVIAVKVKNLISFWK